MMDLSIFLKEELKKIDSIIAESSFLEPRPLLFSYKALDLIDLIRAAASEKVVYFESKDNDFKFLGLGVSRHFQPEEVRDHLQVNRAPLFVQGKFETSDKQYEIFLPEWSFIQRGNETKLIIHPSLDFQTLSPSNLLFNTEVWESFLPVWNSYEENPEHDEWVKMIADAQDSFAKAETRKIVLSRSKIYRFDEYLDPLKFFVEFYRANQDNSHFSVFHQTHAHCSFMSFSPEKLFTLKNSIVETLSLAGSIPRGKNAVEDQVLIDQLISTPKLIEEQLSVTEEIKSLLSLVCTDVSVSELKIMHLPYIFHRQKDITGKLKKETDVFHLIDLLHPTPAVGGVPRIRAAEKILEIEKKTRMQYAAPVGIISDDFTEIAVGIRSAILDEMTLTLFGGAGIVPGSIAEEEWNETGTKMKPFLKVINKH